MSVGPNNRVLRRAMEAGQAYARRSGALAARHVCYSVAQVRYGRGDLVCSRAVAGLQPHVDDDRIEIDSSAAEHSLHRIRWAGATSCLPAPVALTPVLLPCMPNCHGEAQRRRPEA